MTTERPIDDADAQAASQWLDGLAGRTGAGPEHTEGGRLRAALAPTTADRPAARWADIEARARAGAAAGGDAAPSGAGPTIDRGRSPAANEPGRWWWMGWAAALLVGVGLVMLMPLQDRGTEPAWRGLERDPSTQARWVVERPIESAEALAQDLRAAKAEVTVTRQGDAVVLAIQAPPQAVPAVNARLAPLETGVDSAGRLQLVVMPAR
ncbi:MAG: hypothetical protein U1F53_23180 [Burkholderiaceae bacterium]